jgi:energy-coupling factor transporter ATP-binding protein EcfA2
MQMPAEPEDAAAAVIQPFRADSPTPHPFRAAYIERVNIHAAARDRERRTSASLSRWRLLTFLPGFGLLIWGITGAGSLALGSGTILLLAFAVLVVRHARVEERVSWFEALRTVNERAIARLDRNWDALPAADPPAGMSLDAHPYAQDLDLFGRASLFQWLGPAATSPGSATLARWLAAAADPAEVISRQDAVDDLAGRAEWREQLAAYGAATGQERPEPYEKFLGWAEGEKPPLPHFELVQLLVYGLVGSIWVLIPLHVAGVTPAFWPIPLLAGIILSFTTAASVQHAFDAAGSGEVMLRRYGHVLEHVVTPQFEAPALVALRRRLRSEKEPAPRAMARLNRILGFSELRRGAALLHFPIQALTLWDFHVLFALLRWRRSAGTHVREWLDAAGEMDALACLAAVRHNYPAWCRPRFSAEKVMSARALAHPLIPDDRRVANDVTIGPPGTVLLVTGSNMSGKSTLLRAIGLNAVLAHAGGPACAADLQMPPCDLQTSIRIQDSLERGMSYFMAALARLKGVVDAAERRTSERVLLYILDEILQGTNSAERGIAVQAVARHLLDAGAIGAMTTHDLAMAAEEPLRSAAVLVHFSETVDENGAMEFDYKLRSGIATSRNALRLMQLIGIR